MNDFACEFVVRIRSNWDGNNEMGMCMHILQWLNVRWTWKCLRTWSNLLQLFSDHCSLYLAFVWLNVCLILDKHISFWSDLFPFYFPSLLHPPPFLYCHLYCWLRLHARQSTIEILIACAFYFILFALAASILNILNFSMNFHTYLEWIIFKHMSIQQTLNKFNTRNLILTNRDVTPMRNLHFQQICMFNALLNQTDKRTECD